MFKIKNILNWIYRKPFNKSVKSEITFLTTYEVEEQYYLSPNERRVRADVDNELAKRRLGDTVTYKNLKGFIMETPINMSRSSAKNDYNKHHCKNREEITYYYTTFNPSSTTTKGTTLISTRLLLVEKEINLSYKKHLRNIMEENHQHFVGGFL